MTLPRLNSLDRVWNTAYFSPDLRKDILAIEGQQQRLTSFIPEIGDLFYEERYVDLAYALLTMLS